MPHVATVTIPAAASTLSSFPVLVTPNSVAAWDTFWSTVTASGGDIRCYLDDDTTELAREIVALDTTGKTGEIHIKVGTVSNTLATDIHIWADGSSSEPAVTATYGRNAVWADYQIVGHGEAGGTDSTGNGTPAATGSPTDVTGKIGGAQGGLGSSVYYSVASGTFGYPLTLQGWGWAATGSGDQAIRPIAIGDASATDQQINIGADLDGATTRTNYLVLSGGTSADTRTQGTTIVEETWYMLHAVSASASDHKQYTNGALDGSDTTSVTPTGIDNIRVGASADSTPFGRASRSDEWRVRYGELTANWIAYEHANQNDPPGWYTAAAAGGLSPPPWIRRRRFTPLLVR